MVANVKKNLISNYLIVFGAWNAKINLKRHLHKSKMVLQEPVQNLLNLVYKCKLIVTTPAAYISNILVRNFTNRQRKQR